MFDQKPATRSAVFPVPLSSLYLSAWKNVLKTVIVNETAAGLLAEKIANSKEEEKLAENKAEVLAAAERAASQKVAEIKQREDDDKAITIGEKIQKSMIKKLKKEPINIYKAPKYEIRENNFGPPC